MSTFISEQIILESETKSFENIVMFLNADGNVFVSNEQDDATNFWFSFTKGDWEEIKKFLDNQFSKV